MYTESKKKNLFWFDFDNDWQNDQWLYVDRSKTYIWKEEAIFAK